MKRNVTLEEISDGKLYTSNDMVKTDCGGCKGCSSCCSGMGSSIVLDPYDIWQLKTNLQLSFEELLAEKIELNVVDGLILPNLKMIGHEEKCAFLNQDGRCTIHAFRPGICRLFPLGRYYQQQRFWYILQTKECKNVNRSKLKVKKWLGIPDLKTYEKFILEWHDFLTNLRQKIEETNEDEMHKKYSMLILKEFFMEDFENDFYDLCSEKMKKIF